MTKKIPQTQARASLPEPSPGAETRIGLCTSFEELHRVLLELAAAIYPCLNWLYGEIVKASVPEEVEILAYSPTRFKKVYQGMRVPILQSPFSQRLYQECLVCYVGEDQGTLSRLNPQFVETFALSSFMGVPLLLGGDILGLMFAATFKGETPAAQALHRLRVQGNQGPQADPTAKGI